MIKRVESFPIQFPPPAQILGVRGGGGAGCPGEGVGGMRIPRYSWGALCLRG